MKSDIKEKVIQNQILTWLKFNGFLAWHIPNRGFFNKYTNRYNIADQWFVPGIPDVEVVLSGGRTVRIEVKSKTGKLRPGQENMIEKLKFLGHPVFVARSVNDVEDFFKGMNYKGVRMPEPVI